MTAARLPWLCRRGMRELDLVLQDYLSNRFPNAAQAEQEAFARLVEESDDRLWRCLTGAIEPESPELADVVRQLRARAAYRT